MQTVSVNYTYTRAALPWGFVSNLSFFAVGWGKLAVPHLVTGCPAQRHICESGSYTPPRFPSYAYLLRLIFMLLSSGALIAWHVSFFRKLFQGTVSRFGTSCVMPSAEPPTRSQPALWASSSRSSCWTWPRWHQCFSVKKTSPCVHTQISSSSTLFTHLFLPVGSLLCIHHPVCGPGLGCYHRPHGGFPGQPEQLHQDRSDDALVGLRFARHVLARVSVYKEH